MNVKELIDKLLEVCETPNNNVVIRFGDVVLNIEDITLNYPDGWYGQITLEVKSEE
jgi:hypothetical protein